MRYYKTPVRIIKLKQSDNTKSWWEQGATEFFHAFSYFVGGQCTTVDHSRKQFGSFVLFCFFYKVKHRITTNAAISLPGIYQSEIKAYVHSKP